MAEVTRSTPLPGHPADTGPVTVLCVDDDPACLDLVRSTLEREDAFEVRTVTDPAAALRRLDGVDCVVSDYHMPDIDGVELLARVRERYPRLPFVLLTCETDTDVVAAVLSEPGTDYLEKGSAAPLTDVLATRIRRLVGRRRCAALARRALAAVETARDGVAIVAPDGTFEVVDRTYAARFGYDPADLEGRSWREVYPATEVDRLESTALSVADDGWRWSGRCVGHRKDGGSFTARTTVTALEDGSLAFVLPGSDDD